MLESEWDAQAGKIVEDKFAQRVNGLSAFKAEADVRANALPQSADAYELKLPDEFKPPQGMAFEWNKDDPALAEARKAAFDMKMDQAGFSRMLGVYAANKVQELQLVNSARLRELDKLGSAGPQRIDGVATWLTAKFGDKAAPMISLIKNYPQAQMIETFEDMIKLFSNQGGANFDQRGRDSATDAGKIPGYENMSFIQRRIAQMGQTQQKAAGQGR